MERGPRTLKLFLVAVAVVCTLAFVLITTTATARTPDGRPCGGYWGADDIGTCDADTIRRTANTFGLVALVAGSAAGLIGFVDRSSR